MKETGIIDINEKEKENLKLTSVFEVGLGSLLLTCILIIWQTEEKSLKISESPGKCQRWCDLRIFASSDLM